MTQAAERSEAARLDELAAVTKEYAKFSGPSTGLALTATGLWILGSQWALGWRREAGEVLFVAAPFVWVALALAARSFYQRHGEVIGRTQRERDMRSRGARAAMLFIVFVAALRGIDGLLRSRGSGLEVLIGAAYLGMAMLAVWLVPADPWIAYVYGAVAVLASSLGPTPGRGPTPGWYDGARVVFGVLAVVGGGVDHMRYRRLERRLAALKERA